MKKMRIGIVGSAFNPPHLGHKDILEQIYRDFDEIILLPSYRHAFGKSMVPFSHRLHMASMMAQSFHQEKFLKFSSATPIIVSDIERTIGDQQPGPVFTYDVLNALEICYQKANLAAELTFIIGPDNAAFDTWSRFYRGDEIVKRWHLRNISERVPVHSTQIRELIEDYPRPGFLFASRFKHFMDSQIANYIFDHRLYGVHV